MNVQRSSVLSLVTLAALLSVAACSATPPTRAPLQMVKLETSPGGGSSDTRPLALHSEIEATSSANDLDHSGPQVAEPPKERKNEPVLAQPDRHVGLTKHSGVPVGGNLHGYR